MNVAVIILIRDEALHIRRCLDCLMPLEPRQIFVVDSPSRDEGPEMVRSFVPRGASAKPQLVVHEWPGNQARQFNWALDHLPIEAEWVLRLDADEYLTPQTIEKLQCGLADIPLDVAALTFELKRRFMGGEIRHATNGIRQVRMFRYGRGRYPDTLMDERIAVEGRTAEFDGAFYDDNLNSLEWWKAKHRGYARREAAQAIAGTFPDVRKASYYRLPRYLRAVLYFCIRYFFKLGFLDGVAGWRWNFWQGLWYRWLVDREIGLMGATSE